MARTWVLGHRGDSAHAPENTLAAFEAAFRAGADGIELDTMLSADGVPVVIHDAWLQRTTGVPGSVFLSTVADLKKLDAGAWFSDKFRGERIPTLAEALDLGRNRGIVNVEIKSPKQVPFARTTDAVLRVIDTWAHPEQIVVSSFDPRIVARVHRRAPWLKTGFLRSYTQRGPWRSIAWLAGADWMHVDAPLAEVASRSRTPERVVVWTVDHPTEIARLAAEGVRAIVTNVPGTARAVVDSLRARRTGVMP
ncbi:MAG TPA: glycerophosphodiester phosphodiesterase family protein [bacterium]|nr:glycerophosphodiester phosphodiesterase family protein [bacterium]